MYYLVGEEKGKRKEEKKSESKAGKDEIRMDDVELKRLKEMNDKLMAAYKKERRRNDVYM